MTETKNDLPLALSDIHVEGFKSLRDQVRVDLRRLTVLAGANSSGKSSLIQPVLLLKQTYDPAYDPGPLWLGGPNVETHSELLLLGMQRCRETLATMDSEGYALAMSDPLWDEWNRTVAGRPTGSWDKYASQYTMRWFVTMQSRDRVVWKDLPEPDPLHERVMKVAYAICPF